MMHDIWCVTWKELMLTRRNLKSYYTGYGIVVGVWGVLFPSLWLPNILSPDRTEAIIPMLWFGYLSVFLASGQTISAFVGERMQKTLGTLLTTRLSDAAIYLGKVLAIIIIAYSVMLLVLALHLSTVLVGTILKGYELRFPYSPLQLVFLLVLPILALLYTSALGVFISLKSDNIRGQHFLNLFMGLPVFIVFYFVLHLLSWLSLLVAMILFAMVGIGITGLSIRRFNRQTLILK